ncbi:MAG: PhnD/SsuA/transferrin family substrate-binding protein [Polyangiaceae bacterium]
MASVGASAVSCQRNQGRPLIIVLSPGHGADSSAVGKLEQLLREAAKREVVLRVGKSADEALRMATSAGTDAALLTLFEYLFARRLWQVQAALQVLRNGGKHDYAGEILVLKSGGATDLGALADQKIAYVDRYSTTGFLLAAKMLADKGVRVIPLFTGSHDAALEAVRRGQAAAAAAYAGAADKFQDLHAIARTESVPNEPLFFRADIDKGRRESITAAWSAVAATPAGKAALASIAGIDGVEPIDDRAYEGAFHLIDQAGRSVQELVPRGWLLANEKARPLDVAP